MTDARAPAKRQGRRTGEPAPTQVVTIDEIGAGGVGVGRLADGRVVFVHGTAPGDRVEVQPDDVRKDWARASLIRVVEPGPDRRDPPCRHAGTCGGCTLQHLTYEGQLAAKANIVARAFRHIAHLDLVPDSPVPSPARLAYRNRVSFGLRRLGSGRVVAGFHALGEPSRLLDIGQECALPETPVAAAWGALRREWGRNAERLPSGRTLRLTLRGSERNETTLLIEGGHGTGRPDELVERVPGLVAILQRTRAGTPCRRLAGRSGLAEVWSDERADIRDSVFLQVNRGAARLLEDWVVARIGEVSGLRIVDAYCGLGLQAQRLARLGATVTGIEVDPAAVREARRRSGESVTYIEGRVEARLPEALPTDVLIANPPRAGLDAAVASLLVATPPRRMIYVSCDPATLARDLDRLSPALRPATVRCFDLFPQTAHVETAVELQCATS